jgi:hypothetical protein
MDDLKRALLLAIEVLLPERHGAQPGGRDGRPSAIFLPPGLSTSQAGQRLFRL